MIMLLKLVTMSHTTLFCTGSRLPDYPAKCFCWDRYKTNAQVFGPNGGIKKKEKGMIREVSCSLVKERGDDYLHSSSTGRTDNETIFEKRD